MTLKDVIWQGRNQAIHWDEGHFNPAVQNCFDVLAASDASFLDYESRNCAFNIVNLLGWRTVEAFVTDLLSLV